MSTTEPVPAIGTSSAVTSMIRALTPSLGRSEALVAALVVQRPADVLDWSVAQVASAAGVSPATVVRACQSLGFNGFNSLRDALRGQAPPQPVGDDAEAALQTVQAVYATGRRQIEGTLALLDAETIDLAVSALCRAPRVLVSTLNDLAVLGQYAVLRFAMIGRQAEAPGDPITLTTIARLLHEDDVLLSISHTGASELTLRIAASARAAGATVIAITGFARSPMAEIANLSIVVGVAEPAAPMSARPEIRVSQMLMVDALRGAMADRMRAEAAAAQASMHEAAIEYVHRRERPES